MGEDEARAQALRILQGHDLLGRLTRAEMDALLRFARRERHPPGRLLFQKGDPGDSLFAVLSGEIRISTLSELGKEVILNILGPGEIFGEIALLDGKPRTADASTMGASELLVIARRDFMPFLAQHPDLGLRLLEVLCARIRWVSEAYEDVVFKRLPNRLAKKLLFLAESFGSPAEAGVEIGVRLSQQELANMVAASRESINKQMKLWQAAELIAYEQGLITILDEGRLEDIVATEEIQD